jgi:L-histidine N-alpha-methyltransferase
MITTTLPTRTDTFLADVLAGLGRPQKEVSAKYFYDAAGSCLFDRITELDEYYLTRTELGIMRQYADRMAARCGSQCLLVELGAGSLVKVRLLLDRLHRPAGYVPVDMSDNHLHAAAAALVRDYPNLAMLPICADFTGDFPLPDVAAARRVVFFPGSTIGNFVPAKADELLRRIARLAGRGSGLLLGVDLQKDPRVIEAAYNDRRGVTAAFNRNLLVRINRELAADFDLDAFRHRAFYNREQSRIEMHLVSLSNQQVRIADAEFRFRTGETIHTENSYKYNLADLNHRAARCGLRTEDVWTDERNYFAVLYLKSDI